MAGERIAAAGGFNQDIRPHHPGLDVHRSNLENAHADFVLAEPGALAPDHRPVRDFYYRWEQPVSLRPTTGLKCLRRHIVLLLWMISRKCNPNSPGLRSRRAPPHPRSFRAASGTK